MTDFDKMMPGGELKDGYSQEDIDAERNEILRSYRSMQFGEQARQTVIACMKKCSTD